MLQNQTENLSNCVIKRDLEGATALLKLGYDPFKKDHTGFSAFDRAKNLGLIDFCNLFNSGCVFKGMPAPGEKAQMTKDTSNNVKKPFPIIKYIFYFLIWYVVLSYIFFGKPACSDSGWIDQENKRYWSDDRYQECLNKNKN